MNSIFLEGKVDSVDPVQTFDSKILEVLTVYLQEDSEKYVEGGREVGGYKRDSGQVDAGDGLRTM
jgi:hypothetical protein